MPDGGDLSISTAYQPAEESISIKISDTGTGIPIDVQANIFEPFFTTKEYGTGLGLAVSYEIIQHHNGDIFIQNNPDKGATFTVTLPCENLVLQ